MPSLFVTALHTLYAKDEAYFYPKFERKKLEDIPWKLYSEKRVSTTGLLVHKLAAGSAAMSTNRWYNDENGRTYYRGEFGLRGNMSMKGAGSSAFGSPYVSLTILVGAKSYEYDHYVKKIPLPRTGKLSVTVKAKVMTCTSVEEVSVTKEIHCSDENTFLFVNTSARMYPKKRRFFWDKNGNACEWVNRPGKEKGDTWFWEGHDIEKVKDPAITMEQVCYEDFYSLFSDEGLILEDPIFPRDAHEVEPKAKTAVLDQSPASARLEVEDLDKIALMLVLPVQAMLLTKVNRFIHYRDYYQNAVRRMREYLGADHPILAAVEPLYEKYCLPNRYLEYGGHTAFRVPLGELFIAEDIAVFRQFAAYLSERLAAARALREAGGGTAVGTMAEASVRFYSSLEAHMSPEQLGPLYDKLHTPLRMFELYLVGDMQCATEGEAQEKRMASEGTVQTTEKQRRKAEKSMKRFRIVLGRSAVERAKEKVDKTRSEQKVEKQKAKAELKEAKRKNKALRQAERQAKKRSQARRTRSLRLPRIHWPSFHWPSWRLPTIRLPRFRMPSLRLPSLHWPRCLRLNLGVLWVLLLTLLCFAYMILEQSGIIYLLEFGVSWAIYPHPYSLVLWLVELLESEWGGCFGILLVALLIMVAAIVETVRSALLLLLGILLATLLVFLQIGYLWLIPLAALVFAIIFTVGNIMEEDNSLLTKILSVLLSLIALVCTIQYLYFVVYISIWGSSAFIQ